MFDQLAGSNFFGSWELGVGSWELTFFDPLAFGSWNLGFGSWTLNLGVGSCTFGASD